MTLAQAVSTMQLTYPDGTPVRDILVCTVWMPTPHESTLLPCSACQWWREDHPDPAVVNAVTETHTVRCYDQTNGAVALIALPKRQRYGDRERVSVAYGTPRAAWADLLDSIECGT